MNSGQLLVVLTCGAEDGGRKAAIALGVALSALAVGRDVYVFLSLESSVFATPTGARAIRPRGFSDSIHDYLEHFAELGGKLEVCSSCFEEYCRDLPKDEHGKVMLRPGTKIESLGIVAQRSAVMPILTF
jgi:predicted peroxiredoxin